MPLFSMTGYASAQVSLQGPANPTLPQHMRLGLEIRSVNSRFLDLSFRLPDELREHEPAIRELITSHLKRGKVEVRASFESNAAQALLEPSVALLQRLNHLQDQIKAWLPHAKDLSVSDVLKLGSQPDFDKALVGPALIDLAQSSIKQLIQSRQREGERLAKSLIERIEQIQQLNAQALPLVPCAVEQQRLRFLERWREAMGLVQANQLPDTVQERALAEATAYAVRIDVSEELTRLGAHLEEIQSLLIKGGKSEGIGKRLDFLIQELHREANTLGSKSTSLDLTRISVDMKVLIEQMREQVQNLE
ncbi:MAG: YicC/YloC family endoribonuclease [Betaproteobacteria bacterium]|nr:YicC family protein [Betaproteobacteria bacterium]NBT66258.1 YicC family protein [Betaproteobacteria bacterium]NBY06644.1 YicC family protein [Betaproteobacteria bacterium]